MMDQHADTNGKVSSSPATYAGVITVGAILALVAIRLLLEHN